MSTDKNEDRISRNILTKFERTSILGFRSSQLQYGAKPLVDFDENNYDIYEIAKKELEQKVLPYKIKRFLPNNRVEIWDLKELIQIKSK